MKKLIICMMALVAAASGLSAAPNRPGNSASEAVPIGTQIENLKFTDIRGLRRELADLGTYKAIVLTFTTTSCPLVRKSLPKLTEMYQKYREQDVLFVAVNVGADDTIREMASQAVTMEVPFYFVKDDNLYSAKALGVTRTPEVAVLDSAHTLRYRGRIDDQFRIGGTRPEPSRHDLQEALNEILSGNAVSVPQTSVDGCEITPPIQAPLNPDVTWSADVAAIVHGKCANCHRPGTAAPFALLSYEDASSNAAMISQVVANESMPPWYSAEHGKFQNETALTQAEKQILLDWISAGRPAGDLSLAPAPPEPPQSEWRIGEPDVVISMIEQHSIPATGFIPYKYTVLPYVFLGETWVEAVEIKPDNPAVVHHCNMAYVTSDGAGEETFITGYVPGGQPMDLARFNNGTAVHIPSGAGLGLQIHYTTTGQPERCRIRVGLRFPRSQVNKQVRHFLLDPRGWRIPPHDPAFRIEASRTLNRNADLLGMFTHMHVRGRDMTFYATEPDKAREILLQIPNYNFEWQLGYELNPGTTILPKGTVVSAVAHFDNSSFNPYNPDPTATVKYGLQTVDEMFNGFVFYVDHDEALQLNVDPKTGRRVDTSKKQ
ncbi:MAG: redoxin family protein [Planctomycetaceae bacterium]